MGDGVHTDDPERKRAQLPGKRIKREGKGKEEEKINPLSCREEINAYLLWGMIALEGNL